MSLNTQQMLDRMLAGDAAYNGRFYTGVLSTGIYCLPSCGARKPKPENVRFFRTPQAAQAFGLRACKRCRPDEFTPGEDREEQRVEGLVRRLRASPADYPTVDSLASDLGCGLSALNERFRRYYHASPASVLHSARIAWACRALLESERGVIDVAFDAGYQTSSAFYDNFRKRTGMTPSRYRALGGAMSFEVELPEVFPLEHWLRHLARDPHDLTARLTGGRYTVVLRVDGAPLLVELEVTPERVYCRLTEHGSAPAGAAVVAHQAVVRLLGLAQDPTGFENAARKRGLVRWVGNRQGLRIPQVPDLTDALLWIIVGQQINVPFAAQLRRSVILRAGTEVDDGLYAPPAAADLARLEVDELVALRFSRRKAEYLIGAARLVASGALPLAELPEMPATRAERTLRAVRGLGPWSANYFLMRACGFMDCVPQGDTGLASGLQRLLALDRRPSTAEVATWMDAFARVQARVVSEKREMASCRDGNLGSESNRGTITEEAMSNPSMSATGQAKYIEAVVTEARRMAEEVCLYLQEDGRRLEDVEQEVVRQSKALGNVALSGACQLLEEAYPSPTQVCACGQTAHYQRRRKVQVKTVLGTIALKRAYYLCPDCQHGHAPLDARLGVCPGSISAGLDELLAYFGCQESFAQAAQIIGKLTLLSISPNRIRASTEALAAAVSQAQDQAIQAAWQVDQPPPPPQPAQAARMYVSMDGTMVHTREEAWKECKLGAIYDTRCLPSPPGTEGLVRAQHISYLATLSDPETFGRALWLEANRRGLPEAQEIIAIGDGAHWIWRLVAHHFPEATQVVDFYHATQHLWAAAHALHGEGTAKARQWAKARIDQLWNGRVDRVIGCLAHHAPRQPVAQETLTYFRNNRHRMRYPDYRARGIQTASGPIESGCKHVIAARLKCAGMRWLRDSVADLALLRAWLKSDRWLEAIALRPLPARSYSRLPA